MATTEKYYDGDGSNQTFAIPASIPFLDTTDIKVQVGSLKVADGTGNPAGQTLTHGIATAEFPNDTDLKVRISTVLKTLNTDYTLSADKTVITFTDAVPSATGNIRVCTNGSTQNQGTDYTINASNEVAFTTAPANTKSVRIYRETDLENLKGGEFAPGTAITAAQLNDNAKQALYAAQEFPANFGDARNYGWNIPAATRNDIQVISDTDWKIVDDAIVPAMIQNEAVETDKIKNLNVTTGKLADNAIIADKIAGGAVEHSKLGIDTNIYRAYTSIRDYNATGDGSTDDTTAIKNAIAAQDGTAFSNNVLYFPAGTYLVTKPIEIPSNTYIQGAGMDRTIIKMKNTIGKHTGLCVVGNPDAQVTNVTINDITFDGNKDRWHDYNASSGTSTTGTKWTHFEGVYGIVVDSGATYTQSGKVVTVSKINHGLEHGAYVRIISAQNDTSSIVNSELYHEPIWEVIEVTTDTFAILVSPTQNVTGNNNVITYKECVEGANGKGLFIHNSKNVRLNRVKVVDSPDHNFDISSTATHGAPINTSDEEEFEKHEKGYYLKAALYHGRWSENIYLNQCHSKGAGDDNFTTHFSTNIFFNDCYSEFPRGGKSSSANCNCYEIDDGSSNVTISNCQARGGNDALEIKAHGYAPAPFNIFVNGFTSINSTKGVSLHHSNWYINTKLKTNESAELNAEKNENAWNAFGGTWEENYEEDGDSAPQELEYKRAGDNPPALLSDNGYSLHARNVQLDNIRIIALASQTLHHLDANGNDTTKTQAPEHAIQIAGYRGVSVSNLYISEGLDDRTYGEVRYEIHDDHLPFDYIDANSAEQDSDALIHIRRSCRDLTFTNTVINGYWDKFARAVWIRRRLDEYDEEQNNGGIMFNGFTCIDGPLIAFEGNGSDETYWGTLTNYNIHQNQQIPEAEDGDEDPSDPPGNHWRKNEDGSDRNAKAIDVNSDLWQLGPGTIIGYGDTQSIDLKEWPMHLFRDNDNDDDEERLIHGDDEYSYFERIGNMVICQGKIKDINTTKTDGTDHPAEEIVMMSLPFEPIKEGQVGSVATWDINLAAENDGATDEEIQNMVCMAKTGNEIDYNGTAVNGYLIFRASGPDLSAPAATNIDATLMQVGDLNDGTASINFAITYFCKPNAKMNP